MYLRPCRMCSVENCEKKQQMRQRLRGTFVTSAKFKCEKFLHLFKPGDRVKALIWQRFEYGSGIIKATVTYIRPTGKVIVYLDYEPFEDEEGDRVKSTNMFMELWPKHLQTTDEPPVKVCPECGLPEGKKNRPDWHCKTCKEQGWHKFEAVVDSDCDDGIP